MIQEDYVSFEEACEAAIKSYTDLQQSKKLAEILPIESADMYWYLAIKGNLRVAFNEGYNEYGDFELPCWSLAALLNVLPEYNLQKTDWENKTEYKIVVTINEDSYASKNYDNPLNACYEMILKLNELKML